MSIKMPARTFKNNKKKSIGTCIYLLQEQCRPFQNILVDLQESTPDAA